MTTLAHSLLADVLASLENASGTPLGTAAHLRVQELVRQLPDDTQPEELKTLLAPLLCKSAEEQEQFYEMFKKSWARVQETGELQETEIEEVEEAAKVEKRKRRWGKTIGFIVGVLLAVGAFVFWPSPSSEKDSVSRSYVNVRVGESGKYPVPMRSSSADFKNECPLPDSTAASVTWDSVTISVGASRNERASYYANIHYTGIRAGVDSFCIQVRVKFNDESFRRRYVIIFNVLDSLATPPPVVEDKPEVEDTTLYTPREIPHSRDLSQLLPPQPTATQQFLLAWEWPLKLAAILLSCLLLWWLARRIERKRRRLIAEHRPNVKPPYAWNLSLGTEPEVAFGEDFYNLLLQLRRRESDELWRLDVPRTIRATVDRGGLPLFKYAQQTRPAEYLLLIDRQSSRDHQARFFDLLYRAFRAQEVLVERYWYNEGDPRRCYNEAHPGGIPLRDLHYMHPQSRVLLLGNAYALLHPGTNQPAKWAVQTFSAWTDRAVLSTQPLSTFGRRERNLQDLFHVLPASLSGLRDAIELFDADENKTPDLNPRRFPDAALEPIELIDNDLMKTLQWTVDGGRQTVDGSNAVDDSEFIAHHSSFIIPWLAACALYPELHWDLTLQLGQLLVNQLPVTSQPNHSSLITHNSLQALCRFPWFTEGEMPLEVRQTLLAWLEREYPETHYRLREGLHRLLSQNPPPEGSAAYDDFAMNLALNEWLYTRDRDRKKTLQRDIAARLAAGQPADFMVLRMLDPQRALTPEQFEVPDDWKKHLREKGFAFLNPRRAWWWAVPIWLVLSGLALWWGPERAACDGLTATHRGQEFCLENFEEWAIFREMLMLEKIESGQKTSADSLSHYIIGIGWSNGLLTRDHISNRNRLANYSPTTTTSPTSLTEIEKRALGLQMEMFGELLKQNVAYAGVDQSKTTLDSTTFLRNAAVAYFNEGVKIHAAYAQMWEAVERGSQKPVGAEYRTRSEACAYFTKAQEINALLPETAQLWYVQDAARGCHIYSTSLFDFSITTNCLEAAGADLRVYTAPSNRVILTGLNYKLDGTLHINLSSGAYRLRIYSPDGKSLDTLVVIPKIQELKVALPLKSFVIQLGDKCQIEALANQAGAKFQWSGPSILESGSLGSSSIIAAPNREGKHTYVLTVVGPNGCVLRDTAYIIVQRHNSQSSRTRDQSQPITTVEQADDDSDGIPNATDLCPKIKGTPTNRGCPDGDLYQQHTVLDGESLRAIAIRYSTDLQELAVANGMDANDRPLPGKIVLIPVPKPKPLDLVAVLAEIEKNMVSIPGGSFQMGCDEKRDGNCNDDEKPLHEVRLSGFSISKYEVTQAQWRAVMGKDPSYNTGCDNCPVESVMWNDVQKFIKALNGLTKKTYRLPTEAEWEYAARGGNKSQNYRYSGSNDVDEVAWYTSNYAAGNTFGSQKKTRPVGTKKPNELGLYDMSGNVWEWCSDQYDEKYYSDKKAALSNPQGPKKGSIRVVRGGSWSYALRYARAAERDWDVPDYSVISFGFRLARTE